MWLWKSFSPIIVTCHSAAKNKYNTSQLATRRKKLSGGAAVTGGSASTDCTAVHSTTIIQTRQTKGRTYFI